MSKDLGADWGIPYYNKPKPPGFMTEQYQSRLNHIDDQIKALQKERETVLNLMNEKLRG